MIKRLLFIALVVASGTKGFSQSDEKAIILAVEKTVADAFTKHNIPALNAAFADDIAIITQTGESINKQQLLQYVNQINSVTVSDMQVKIKGNNNFAVVTGIELETGKDSSGSAYSNKSRFTDVLEKKNGQWTIFASQATSMNQ